MKTIRNIALLVATIFFAHFLAPPALTADAPLLSNGTFETDANADQWPDDWGRVDGARWETENGNHFLRLVSQQPGKLTMLYRQVNIPAGVKALEMTWRQRVSDLKLGKQAWFDARILLDFRGDGDAKLGSAPAPATRKNTAGWEEKSTKFLVPEGAKLLAFMPSLFQVESGTFDLDDIVIKPAAAAPLQEAANAADVARKAKLEKDAAARRAKAAASAQPDGSLVSNGNFEADKNADKWPDDWGRLTNGGWESEGDNHFLRITAPEPGKLNSLYRLFDLPAATKALELKWRQRITDLKPGKEAWFDARIMMNFKDAAGNKVEGGPGAPYTRGSTNGWVAKSAQFLVPENALTLEFMPCLFQVEKGTFDLDDISLKPMDAAILAASAKAAEESAKKALVPPEAPNKAKWPQELHVAGNQILSADGKPVWLQGVNVVSLEWNPLGERVLRSALTAIEEWKSNVIRLPVKEEYWFGKSAGQKDRGAAYRELVDQIITLVANRGAYVLLDLHRFGAPKKAHADFWKDAAARYKNHPAVLFDLFNEPHDISWEVWKNGGFVPDKNTPADEDNFLTPEEKAQNAKGYHSIGHQALIDAARSGGAKNIVLVGGLDWAYDLSGIAKGFALDDKTGNGIVYNTHIYAGKRDWPGKVLCIADKHPILVGEVGANTKKFTFIPAADQEDATTWVPKVLGFIQKYKLHWTAFSFHPGAAPVLIKDWDYTPTPEWGAPAKEALAGKKFEMTGMR